MADPYFEIDSTSISTSATSLKVDHIAEKTAAHGVALDDGGILAKDTTISADHITEISGGHGVDIDGITLKDNLSTSGITPIDGWIVAGTFTYASAVTITVASGAASIYKKGDKIKLVQARSQAYTNDPAAGSNIELNMTDTSGFNVGNKVLVSSSAGSEVARVTVVHTNTHITVDTLALNHTTTNPLVYIGTTTAGTKYFYITAVADTTLTINGGADYTLENAAITSPYYSHIENPIGLPGWFNVAVTWNVASYDNGSGGQPTTSEFRFRITGNMVTAHYRGNGTKAGAGIYLQSTSTGLPTMVNSTSFTSSGVVFSLDAIYQTGSWIDNASAFFPASIADNQVITHFTFTINYEI